MNLRYRLKKAWRALTQDTRRPYRAFACTCGMHYEMSGYWETDLLGPCVRCEDVREAILKLVRP